VNVIDDTAPVLVCQDINLEIGPDGTATLDPMDLIDMTNSVEACGYDIVTADIIDFDCSNVGTPVLVTVFAADPSGNIASCSAMVTATDTTGPTITCPDDVNVDPEANGVYTLEDFTADAVAVDNCTDPVTIITQDPAAGTPLGVGTYTITISAEDDLGNIGTCDFTLVVDPIQGVNDTAFDAAITMFPNPADNVVTIANKSNIALENAAIYDINGKLVSTIDLAGMQSERTINVAALASGVYVVQITGENAVTTKRLIKK
ncbi:T9SS type A sorting domain-containing protein, partial [Patiriisocius hiemis]